MMGSIINGKSIAALKHFRKNPAALAIYWEYCARVNGDNVAYPSLRGLVKTTGWQFAACQRARAWLVEHKALESVDEYVRPEWRAMPLRQRQQRINLDRSEYYRPTGYLEVDGVRYEMLYLPNKDANAVAPEVSDDIPNTSSKRRIIESSDHRRGISELNTSLQLDTISELDTREREDARAGELTVKESLAVQPIEENPDAGPDSPTQEDSTPQTPTPVPPPPSPLVLDGLGMSSMAALSRQDAELKAFRAVKADPYYVAFVEAWRATLAPENHDTLVPEVMPLDALKHQKAIDRLKLMGATPEHVRKVVASKRAAGKHEYPFTWLPKDVQALQVKEADVASGKPGPAPSMPRPATPAQPGRTPAPVVRLQDAKRLTPKPEEDKSA